MAFGKRGATPPTWSAARPSGEEGSGDTERAQHRASSNGGGSGAVMGIVLAVVGIAAGVGGALLHSSWSPGAGTGPAVAAQPSDLGAHKRIADSCMPPLPPQGTTLRRINQSDEEYRYARALASADYFTCALTQERERFCAGDEKRTLIKELEAYFGHVAAKQRIYDKYVGERAARTVVKMAEAIEGDGVSSRPQRPEPHASVIAVIQDLIREGFLAEADFGWTVPAELAPYLGGVARVKASC